MYAILPADISNIHVYTNVNAQGFVSSRLIQYNVRLTDGTIHSRSRLSEAYGGNSVKDLTGKTNRVPVVKANEAAMKAWIISKEETVGATKLVPANKKHDSGALASDVTQPTCKPMTEAEISIRKVEKINRNLAVKLKCAILPADISNVHVYTEVNPKGFVSRRFIQYHVRLPDGTTHLRSRLKEVYSPNQVKDPSGKSGRIPVAKVHDVAMKTWIIGKEETVGAANLVPANNKHDSGALGGDRIEIISNAMTEAEIRLRNGVMKDRELAALKAMVAAKDKELAALKNKNVALNNQLDQLEKENANLSWDLNLPERPDWGIQIGRGGIRIGIN